MKKLLIGLLLLSGCTFRNHEPNCKDGAIIKSWDGNVNAFCEYYKADKSIHGYHCWVKGEQVRELIIDSGYFAPVRCFDPARTKE